MGLEDLNWFYGIIDALVYYRLFRPIYKRYIKHLKMTGNENILDFGCGGGASSKPILNNLSDKGHLTCIDTSNYWVSKAKKRLGKYPNVDFIAGDIKDTAMPNEIFDVITIMYVLHHIPIEERLHILSTLCSKLKKGGKILILEPTKKQHGIQIKEIKKLMIANGLKEIDNKVKKNLYFGIFYNSE